METTSTSTSTKPVNAMASNRPAPTNSGIAASAKPKAARKTKGTANTSLSLTPDVRAVLEKHIEQFATEHGVKITFGQAVVYMDRQLKAAIVDKADAKA